MHVSKLLGAPMLCVILAGSVPAQLGDKPVPGQLPDTERWNVVFEDRDFDLSEFRAAIRDGASAQQVAAIVAGLERKAIAHQATFTDDVEDLGGRVIYHFWLINAATVEIPPQHVATLRRRPNIHSVTPDLETFPVAPIKDATDANHHNSDSEQAIGNHATGYGVAIVDTGQDSNYAGVGRPHEMYYIDGDITNTSGNGIGGSRLVANVQLGSQSADDIHNHGTGVAGIAAGEIWSTAAADRGHANNADIVGYSICNSGGCGSTLAIEAAGWQQAAADKVLYNIVSCNMSYTSSPDPTNIAQQAIDAAALNADIVSVCAAANSGSSTVVSSATTNGLAVGACDNSKIMASFSSRGPLTGDTQRFFPDIAANGVSTVMPQRDSDTSDWVASGTSMAAPQVCGVAALVKSARPCLNASDIKAILLAATEDISGQNPTRDRNSYGMGYMRADLACNVARTPGSVVNDSLDSTTTPDLHTINVVSGQQVSVSLVWMRQILTSTAWSNLGLRVLNGATVVAQNDDPRNVYEVVRFTAPITGTLTVEVSASSLEIADLPYSLAFVNASSQDTALFTTFGVACAGSNGTPTLTFSGLPRIGESYDVNLTNAATNAASVLFVGFSNTTWGAGIPLPFDLTIIGGNGCTVYASSEILRNVTTDNSGSASVTLPTPCSSSFVGLPVYYQYIITDAVNGLGLVSSNAGEGTVGW